MVTGIDLHTIKLLIVGAWYRFGRRLVIIEIGLVLVRCCISRVSCPSVHAKVRKIAMTKGERMLLGLSSESRKIWA